LRGISLITSLHLVDPRHTRVKYPWISSMLDQVNAGACGADYISEY
jgi:hypothetical protein